MAMTPEQTSEWRSKLRSLRSSLERDLATAKETARPVDLDQPIGRLTRVDAMQQQHMALARCQRIENRLQMISGALGRLAAGSYGACLTCGDDIELRRLEARPETFLCLSCQRGQ